MQFCVMNALLQFKPVANSCPQFTTPVSGHWPLAPGLLHRPQARGHPANAAAAVFGFVHKSGDNINALQLAAAEIRVVCAHGKAFNRVFNCH